MAINNENQNLPSVNNYNHLAGTSHGYQNLTPGHLPSLLPPPPLWVSLGGVTENFSSSSNICRFCSITGAEDFQKNPHLLTAPERTIKSYNKAVETLKNGTLDIYNGIKFNSVFNDLLYFHICEPGMPPCIGQASI